MEREPRISFLYDLRAKKFSHLFFGMIIFPGILTSAFLVVKSSFTTYSLGFK